MLACQPNYVGVSAGLVRIDKYLGSAMLTCMDRIEKGSPTSLKHNLPVHPDFLRLYRLRLGMRDEQLQLLDFGVFAFLSFSLGPAGDCPCRH